MAYRIRSLETMTLREVDDIFRRGRGIGRNAGAAPAEAEDKDFTPNIFALDPSQAIIPTPPVEVVEDELELVE